MKSICSHSFTFLWMGIDSLASIRSCSNRVIVKRLNLKPLTQCAAVKRYRSLINDEPQCKRVPNVIKPIHGYSFICVSLPPTIRVLVLAKPHPGGEEKRNEKYEATMNSQYWQPIETIHITAIGITFVNNHMCFAIATIRAVRGCWLLKNLCPKIGPRISVILEYWC